MGEAETLAAHVRRSTGHDVMVEIGDGEYVLQVVRVVGGKPDRYWIRDYDDWEWLRSRLEP